VTANIIGTAWWLGRASELSPNFITTTLRRSGRQCRGLCRNLLDICVLSFHNFCRRLFPRASFGESRRNGIKTSHCIGAFTLYRRIVAIQGAVAYAGRVWWMAYPGCNGQWQTQCVSAASGVSVRCNLDHIYVQCHTQMSTPQIF